MDIYLIINEVNYGDIDDDDYACHDYYIIRFSLYAYTLQVYLIIDGQVISSGKILYKGTYYFPININDHDYFSPKNKSNNTIAYLRKIINVNVNVKHYNSNDVVTYTLRNISRDDFSSLTPLHLQI